MHLGTWLLLICSLTVVSYCGRKGKSKDDSPQAPRDPHSTVEYLYDAAQDKCLSAQGKKGRNKDFLGECGEVSNRDLSGQDFSGKKLAGIYFTSVILNDANFKNADLRSGTFVKAQLKRANLEGANCGLCYFDDSSDLSGAQINGTNFISLKPDGKGLIYTSLTIPKHSKIKFNIRTIMNLSLKEADYHDFVFDGKSAADPGEISLPGMNHKIELATSGTTSLEKIERRFIHDVFKEIRTFQVAAPSEHIFKKIFQSLPGTDGERLFSYVTKRIHYLRRSTDRRDSVVASNSDSIWFNQLYNDYVDKDLLKKPGYKLTTFDFNSRSILMNRPGMGVVNLGNSIFEMHSSILSKIEALAHEARHSDCAKLPTAADLKAYWHEDKDVPTSLASNCHHVHVRCPAEHAMAGKKACDGHLWGSYTVSLAVANAFHKYCTNCNEFEKAEALITDKDMRTRILVLEKLFDGSTSKPDLSMVRYP